MSAPITCSYCLDRDCGGVIATVAVHVERYGCLGYACDRCAEDADDTICHLVTIAPAVDYGHIDELYTAPRSACSCLTAGWGAHTDDQREAPTTVAAPCGWCGTFVPPRITRAPVLCVDCGERCDIPGGICSPCESADLVIASVLASLANDLTNHPSQTSNPETIGASR